MIVQHIHQNYCAQNWNLVENYIKEALQHGDDYSIEQVKVYVLSGTWILLVAVEDEKICGAATVAFSNDANYRTAIITTLSGKNIVTADVFKQVCNAVKSFGATKVQVYARDSAARLYEQVGLAKKATLMEFKL